MKISKRIKACIIWNLIFCLITLTVWGTIMYCECRRHNYSFTEALVPKELGGVIEYVPFEIVEVYESRETALEIR